MANKLLLNLDEFIRVVNCTGETITGRYDGVDYEFPDGSESGVYTDVHRAVAQHILGFLLPEVSDDPQRATKLNALTRLGWVSNSESYPTALRKLRRIQFLEIPPFPTSVVPMNLPRTADESVARVPSPTMGQGAPASTPADAGAPKDPFAPQKKASK